MFTFIVYIPVCYRTTELALNSYQQARSFNYATQGGIDQVDWLRYINVVGTVLVGSVVVATAQKSKTRIIVQSLFQLSKSKIMM